MFRLALPSLPGRGVRLETSGNPVDWTDWPGAGNGGLERPADTPWQIEIPATEAREFFRARSEER